MRCSSLLTLLSTLGACALVFCCLLGGNDPSTLPSVYIFNVNSSKIAHTAFANNTGNGCGCVEFVNGTLTVNGTAVQNLGNSTANATYLSVGEYYGVYTINYCTGQYLPDYQDEDASLALTHCKKPSLSRRFDLETIVEDALTNLGLSPDDINWPAGITNAFLYYHSAGTAMIVFFIAGVAFALLTALAALLALCVPGRLVFMALLISSVLTLVSLAVAAGTSTAIITTAVNGINDAGEDLGLSANQGNLFLALMWSAVALLFIATLTSAVQLCIPTSDRSSSFGRRKERYAYPKGPYSMMPLPRQQDQYGYAADPYSSTRALRWPQEEEYEEDDFR